MHLVGEDAQLVGAPSVLGQAGLATELAQELDGQGQLPPDLGQKGGLLATGPLEDDPVDVGAEQPGQCVGIFVGQGLRFGEDRNLDVQVGQLVQRQRRKAAIVKGGIDGVALDRVE